MKPRLSLFGLAMLSPALLLLTFFFFAPVGFTGVFAFTNMSTATGIGQGAYVLTPNLLRELKDQGLPEDVLTAVGTATYVVNDETLAAARDGGADPDFVDEIEENFAGQTFETARDFEKEIRRLRSAPRRARDLKVVANYFSVSAVNTRFDTRAELADTLARVAPVVAQEMRDKITDAAYTGAVFTTENFTKLATRPETARLIGNTFLYLGLTLAFFNISLGLFLAITLFYLPRKLSGVFSALWLLPRITPVVLYAIMWKWFTWEDGFLPILADHLGLPSFNYMKGSVVTAWTTMILVNGFVGASFGLILFSGALRAIPVQQLWASEVDGATRWQQVRRIILPQMRWPILFVTAYQTLSLLSSYEIIWLTTDGGPGKTTTVWALEAFKTALSNYSGNLQYGMGAAMALILVVVGLTLSIVYLMLFKFNELVSRPKIEF